MKLLITGARGFIGSSLNKFLNLNSDLEVICSGTKECDLLDKKATYTFLNDLRPDYIVHLVGGRVQDKGRLQEINLGTTENILTSILELKEYNPHIVLPGSASEYGFESQHKEGLTEDLKPQPVSLYGRVKYKQTQMAQDYAQQGVFVCIARMFNILGKGTPETLAAGRFTKQVVSIERQEQEPILNTWNLSGKRDFLDIEDICRGLLDIVQFGKKGEVYNVCSSKAVDMRTLVAKIIKHSKVDNIQISENRGKKQDSLDSHGSYQKLKSLNGWKPQVSLDQSIQRMLQSYRS